MSNRRLARCALMIAVASLPFSEAINATPVIQDIGYVGPDGTTLRWGAWQELKSAQSEERRRREREYERCLNPGPGLSDLIKLGERFGRRSGFGFPALPRRERTPRDCGSPPNGAVINNDVRVVEIDITKASDQQAYPTLAQMTFRNTGTSLMPATQGSNGKCMALVDSAGRLVPIRHLDDPDPYGFTNPFTQRSVKVAENRVIDARRLLTAAEAQAANAQSELVGLVSYNQRSGQCVAPPSRQLPPRPVSMSSAEVEDQAAGACLDLAMRRHDPTKVIGAVRSVRWDAMLGSMKRYQQKPAACASEMPSQWNDVGIRMACAISDIGCYGAIQQVIQQCQAQVRRSCGAPLAAWERRVSEIKSGPAQAVAQCNSQQQTVMRDNQQVASLRAELMQAEAALIALRSEPEQSGSLPLSQARCGG